MRLLVTGGTGTFGSHAVPVLLARGHEVRVLSRRERPRLPAGATAVVGDLASGVGVEDALADVDVVLHAASDVRHMGRSDEAQTRRLLAASEAAGIRHVLYLSIVGIDEVSFGYYRKKLACEELIADSVVPHTTLRATQFHDLLGALLRRTERWPVLPLPLDWRLQPISPHDVAEHALDLLEADHPPERDEIGGPDVRTLGELVDTWRSARGGPRPLPLPFPGRTARLIRDGKLTTPGRSLGQQSWAEFVQASPEQRGERRWGRAARPDPTDRAESYDYPHFAFDYYLSGQARRQVRVGRPAIDETLYDLSGNRVRLSSLWSEQPVVIEFGSITCPIFVDKLESMQRVADRFADRVGFYVVYVREAHPGYNYPPHQGSERKLTHARDLRQLERVARPILVDSAEGTMHRDYGALPNATYVIGTDGIISMRADWADPLRLATHLQALTEGGGAAGDVRPEELVDNFTLPNPRLLKQSYRVLRRAGAPARRDILKAAPRMLMERLRLWQIRRNRRSA